MSQQVNDQMHMQRPAFMPRPTSQPVQNWTQPQQLPSQSPVRQQFPDQCMSCFIILGLLCIILNFLF